MDRREITGRKLGEGKTEGEAGSADNRDVDPAVLHLAQQPARDAERNAKMKKGVDRRSQIARILAGLPLSGRPSGRRTGTTPGERSIPNEWRELDDECLEFALKEVNTESWENWDAEQFEFVRRAAHRARFHQRRGNYKIIKLSDGPAERKPTGPRKLRTHEQRVRRRAKTIIEIVRRERISVT